MELRCAGGFRRPPGPVALQAGKPAHRDHRPGHAGNRRFPADRSHTEERNLQNLHHRPERLGRQVERRLLPRHGGGRLPGEALPPGRASGAPFRSGAGASAPEPGTADLRHGPDGGYKKQGDGSPSRQGAVFLQEARRGAGRHGRGDRHALLDQPALFLSPLHDVERSASRTPF